MDSQVLEVEQRTEHGKGVARKMRAAGKLPGILYGHKEEPVSLSLDPAELRARLRKSGQGRNTLFKLQGLSREVLALLKDVQTDPVRRNLLHVDLHEVRDGDVVRVEVPLQFEGKPKGVTAGGSLQIGRRTIALNASPLAIPELITLDITDMDIGDTLSVADVALPEGATAALADKLTLVLVKAPRVDRKAAQAAAAEAAAEG